MANPQATDPLNATNAHARRFAARCLAAFLSIAPPLLATASGPYDYEMVLRNNNLFGRDFDQKPWAEVEGHLPSPPDPANLIQIDVGQLTTNKFAVDRQSVAYGNDEVIRYTLVVTSPSGVRNVSYEGMRCATAERRLYAFGRADGSWSKARNNAWVRIEESALNRQHAALYRDYFCSAGGSVTDTEGARRVLLHGNPEAIAR